MYWVTGAKSRGYRGENHTGAGFLGQNFAEKPGHWGKKAVFWAAYWGKKPQKGRSQGGFCREKARYLGGA